MSKLRPSPFSNFTSSSSTASTASSAASAASAGSPFQLDDDLLADDLFGPLDEQGVDAIDEDDSVLVGFSSSKSSSGSSGAASSSSASTLPHSASLSMFPDFSGDPASLSSQQPSKEQQTTLEAHRQTLQSTCASHLSHCLHHLLAAHRISPRWYSTVHSLTQQTVATVRPEQRKGDLMDIRHYVRVQLIPGGKKTDSSFVDGLVFHHPSLPSHAVPRHAIDSPRILLFAGALEPPPRAQETGHRFLSSLLDNASSAEREWLDRRLPSLLFLRPEMIFVERHVSKMTYEALRQAGVGVVTGVELPMLERLARCTRATVLPGLDVVEGRFMGSCGQLRVEEFGIVIDEAEKEEEPEPEGIELQSRAVMPPPRTATAPAKKKEENSLLDLFGDAPARPPAAADRELDSFGDMLGSVSLTSPRTSSLTSTSPANFTSILASSFYDVGSAAKAAAASSSLLAGGSPPSFSSFGTPSPVSRPTLAPPVYVPFFFLRGCQPSGSHCTLVLRGSRSLSLLHRLHRVLLLSVHIAYNLQLEQALMLDLGLTYPPSALQALEQQASTNIEQARVAMQAVEETGGPPQYLTLLSCSPHITLPPIPFYPSLLNYRCSFPLPLPPHLQQLQQQQQQQQSQQQQMQPAVSQQRPGSASSPHSGPSLPSSNSWSAPSTRDIFYTAPLASSSSFSVPPPVAFDPATLDLLSSPAPPCTALLQANLLVGSCWFTTSGQCRAPDLKQIDFYSSSDKTLSDFLFSNCYDLGAKCCNAQCKKDVFRHVLAYTHNNGRLLITVKQMRPDASDGQQQQQLTDNGAAPPSNVGLPIAHPPVRSSSSPALPAVLPDVPSRMQSPQLPGSSTPSPPPAHGQYSPTSTVRHLPGPALHASGSAAAAGGRAPQGRGATTSTHSSSPTHGAFSFAPPSLQPSPPPPPSAPSAVQPAASASAPPMLSWSRCRLCNQRVTGYTPLSPQSLSFSFGKYLDLTFNNHTAVSTCSSCPHPAHSSHVRYIAIGNVVACFEYEQAAPFAVVARPRVKYDRSEVMEGRLLHLSTLAMTSRQVFDAFLHKISEIESSSRAAGFKDLLQQLQSKVKHEQDAFLAFVSRHGLKTAMTDSQQMLSSVNAALIRSLVEGGDDDASSALFGDDERAERREARPALDSFDIHRLHRKLVLSFIDWNRLLTEMCSFIFPKGYDDITEAAAAVAPPAAAAAASTQQPHHQLREGRDILQISTERSALRGVPAPHLLQSSKEPLPSPVLAAPRTPGSPAVSYSKEPLTPTLFSSLHQHSSSSSSLLSGGNSPKQYKGRTVDGPVSPLPAALLDAAQLKSAAVSLLSDMFTGGSGSKKSRPRSFKPTVTVEELAEQSPKLKEALDELIASPISHGHFHLPQSLGGVTIPVYDDEPSSIIAYTLASVEHMQLCNPAKLEGMKAAQDAAAAAAAISTAAGQLNGSAAGGAVLNGKAGASSGKTAVNGGEANFFDDAVHVTRPGEGGLTLFDSFGSSASSSSTASLFDLSSFGPTPAAAPAPAMPPPHPPAAAAYKPAPFSFASPTAGQQTPLLMTNTSASNSGDLQRAKLLGAVGPRASVSSPSQHANSVWWQQERADWAVEQCMTSGFSEKDKEGESVLKHKFEDQPHALLQPDSLTSFRCTAYFPKQFHALRSYTCLGDYDFIQSLARSDKWASTGGKSGSTFSKTADDRFVLKYVKRTELNMFIDIAPQYFAHMAKVCFHNLPSVLVKILGVYTVSWSRGGRDKLSALDVIVMPNLFYQKTNVKVFDLKGSERNRYIKQAAKEAAAASPAAPLTPSAASGVAAATTVPASAPQTPAPAAAEETGRTLLDLNLWEYTHGLPIPVHESSHSLLRMCLTGDHRVLTRSGWKSITRMQVGDEVLSFNTASYAQEWQPVVQVQSHAVVPGKEADRLYRMQGSGMDVIATRDHRMLLARLNRAAANGLTATASTPVGYETVGELLRLSYTADSRSMAAFAHSGARAVVCAGFNTQQGVKVVIPGLEQVCDWWWDRDRQLAFLQFLGFWLRDGYLDAAHGTVNIGQKKKEAANQWLSLQLLPRVFPRWWCSNEQPTRPGHVIYSIRCLPLYHYLRLMAVGPLGYNPRDPAQLRSYPHFTKDEELAETEQQSDYYQADNSSGYNTTWTEAEMLAAFTAADYAADSERCWWCRAADWEDGNEMVTCSGQGCQRGGHLQCAGLTAASEGDWLCPPCRCVVEAETEDLAPAGLEPMDSDVPALEDGGDEAQMPLAEAVEDPAVAKAMQAAGRLVWYSNGLFIVINGDWFYLKRWLGGRNVANVYSRLSRQQAVALLDGFCRADGDWRRVRYDDSGEPTGQWSCSSSSFPLIDQLMLIGQLAGAAVHLSMLTKAGEAKTVNGHRVTLSCDHWGLYFTFTRPARLPMLTTPLAQPVDVSSDVEGRGNYQYADDKKVWCITVEGNANFLTQRLSYKRASSGGVGVRAHSVFVGNCLHNDSFFLSSLEVIDYSLLVGFDTANNELLVGVIDYIRQYTWDKKLETGMKSMGRIAGQAVPTVINPASYKLRFRAAMERYFMIAPDQCSFFRKIQEKDEESITNYAVVKEDDVRKPSASTGGERGGAGGGSGGGGSAPSMAAPVMPQAAAVGTAGPAAGPQPRTGKFRWGS